MRKIHKPLINLIPSLLARTLVLPMFKLFHHRCHCDLSQPISLLGYLHCQPSSPTTFDTCGRLLTVKHVLVKLYEALRHVRHFIYFLMSQSLKI
ncbi:hypothetical protein KSS87_011880 [Heliosperma pusillum]|nr:hypothetical protein KSS87_011880 [Heliosperma pusillum]